MIALIIPDSAFLKTKDGKYWSETIYSYEFFQRYLDVFSDIIVVSRTREAEYEEVNGFLRSDGPHMTIAELPDLHGMKQYMMQFWKLCKSARKAVVGADCAIIRLPSIPASVVMYFFLKLKKPYALEVVADPEDAYGSNIIAKHLFKVHMKIACQKANGVSYVTRSYLQSKYPSFVDLYGSDSEHFASYYSTIKLPQSYFASKRDYTYKVKFQIIHTANHMNNDLKGHQVLIKAVDILLKEGFDITLKLVGDGELREDFERLTQQLRIADKVCFTGKLSKPEQVREKLLESDIFVFPTKAEGLPRSVIEAMAVGLPCISTPIAGIPELLEEEDMIAPDDYVAFARRIKDFILNPELMNQKSERNIIVAKNYQEDVLQAKRNSFYEKLSGLIE